MTVSFHSLLFALGSQQQSNSTTTMKERERAQEAVKPKSLAHCEMGVSEKSFVNVMIVASAETFEGKRRPSGLNDLFFRVLYRFRMTKAKPLEDQSWRAKHLSSIHQLRHNNDRKIKRWRIHTPRPEDAEKMSRRLKCSGNIKPRLLMPPRSKDRRTKNFLQRCSLVA